MLRITGVLLTCTSILVMTTTASAAEKKVCSAEVVEACDGLAAAVGGMVDATLGGIGLNGNFRERAIAKCYKGKKCTPPEPEPEPEPEPDFYSNYGGGQNNALTNYPQTNWNSTLGNNPAYQSDSTCLALNGC